MQTKICSLLIQNRSTIILFYLPHLKTCPKSQNGVLQEVLVNNNCKHTCICHSRFVSRWQYLILLHIFCFNVLDQNNKYCQWYEMRLDATSQCKFTTIIFFCWTWLFSHFGVIEYELELKLLSAQLVIWKKSRIFFLLEIRAKLMASQDLCNYWAPRLNKTNDIMQFLSIMKGDLIG